MYILSLFDQPQLLSAHPLNLLCIGDLHFRNISDAIHSRSEHKDIRTTCTTDDFFSFSSLIFFRARESSLCSCCRRLQQAAHCFDGSPSSFDQPPRSVLAPYPSYLSVLV